MLFSYPFLLFFNMYYLINLEDGFSEFFTGCVHDP